MALQAAAATAGVPPIRSLEIQHSYKFDKAGGVVQSAVNTKTFYYKLIGRLPGVLQYMFELPTLPTSDVPSKLDGGLSRLRHLFWLCLNEPDTKAGLFLFMIVTLAIFVSVITFCIQTMPEYRERDARGIYGDSERAFDLIETLCVSVFTFDYLGRLLTVTAAPNEFETAYISRFGFEAVGDNAVPMTYELTPGGLYRLAKVNARKVLGFVVSPLNLIDLAAILPYYLALGGASGNLGGSLAIIRVLRLARILRLLRLTKSMQGVRVLFNTVVSALDALGFLMFFVLLACVLFGAIIFFCEQGEFDDSTGMWMRPDWLGTTLEESPFKSIPHSMWYAMVTMTTVGYGDYYPTTRWGKVFGTVTMLCGIMVLALPITVIGSAFTDEFNKFKEEQANKREAAEELKRTKSQAAIWAAAAASRTDAGVSAASGAALLDESLSLTVGPLGLPEVGMDKDEAPTLRTTLSDPMPADSASQPDLSYVNPMVVTRAAPGPSSFPAPASAPTSPVASVMGGPSAEVQAQLAQLLELVRQQSTELQALRKQVDTLSQGQGGIKTA